MFASNTSQVSQDAVYVEDVFSTYLYTGNNSTQTITNGIDLSGKGGLVWVKGRNESFYHRLASSPGPTLPNYLASNATDAASSGNGNISAFSSTGFTVNNNSGSGGTNSTGINYVSWTFRKQAKFFDVVTYTGNGTSNRAINHSLGAVPGCVIVKKTNAAQNWTVWHRTFTIGDHMYLNTTGAVVNNTVAFGSNANTSTTFNVGAFLNANGDTYVAYLFAHDAGGFGLTGTDNVISCGSFTASGGGLATVTLGWEPQWILFKATSTTDSWMMYDSMRGIATGGVDNYLAANSNSAENFAGAAGGVDLTATGFQTTAGGFFGNDTYIYIAIRRGPMKKPTSGTSVFSPNTVNAAAGTAVTTGFPVDLQILGKRSVWTNYNYGVVDRLRGVSSTSSTEVSRQIVTSAVSAEITNTTYASANFGNTGFAVPSTLASTSSIFLSFRRAPSFLSVAAWSGTGTSSQTISHDLGATPEMMFVYNRTTNNTRFVYHSALGAGSYVGLNSNAPTSSSGAWNNTPPTATNFTVGSTNNSSGDNFVAHLFASCPGVSKVGSYTGTGAARTIDCGFPSGARMVLVRRTSSTGDWYLYDTARGMVSGSDPYGLLNNAAGDWTGTEYLLTAATGFSLTSSAPADLNGNGATFIYLAIA